MKKLFLTLLLVSPLAKSEMLELTCESAFPFWVSVDLDSKEGTITFPENTKELDKLGQVAHPYSGIKKIRSLQTKSDYYVVMYGSKFRGGILFINRINLYFLNAAINDVETSGTCTQGIDELPEYQI